MRVRGPSIATLTADGENTWRRPVARVRAAGFDLPALDPRGLKVPSVSSSNTFLYFIILGAKSCSHRPPTRGGGIILICFKRFNIPPTTL